MSLGVVDRHSESQEAGAKAVEEEMAQVCGALNATTGRLVLLIARALETGACEGTGIHSPEQWVGWKCGVSGGRARRLVAMARRLPELPETLGALQAGELSEDQVAVVCRHAPAYADAEVATLARHTTVSQLTRTLRRYTWAPKPDEKEEEEEDKPEEPEARRVDFGTTEEGGWRLSALLPPDEGALVERALDAARRALIDEGQLERPTWADAFLAMADRSLGATAASRPHHDRHPPGRASPRRRARSERQPPRRPAPTLFAACSAATGGCARWPRLPGWRSAWAARSASCPNEPA